MYVAQNGIVHERLRSGLAAPYVEGFADWLDDNGYANKTVRELVRLLAGWTHWMSVAGYTLDNILTGFEASRAVVSNTRRVRRRGDINRDSIGVAALFMRYLQDQRVLARPTPSPSATQIWPILGAFRSWMRQHRGMAETTLELYQGILIGFLEALGDDPRAYSAEAIRAFILERNRSVGLYRKKGIAVAIRAFLRYLIATGKCPPGRDHAVPSAAGWRMASVPKYLAAEDIERVIDACQGEGRLRDRAVILLLARLGLRASEVAGLGFADIDWENGRIRLCGKSRREEHLPLTQEVGDAILAYIARGRPSLPVNRLFITQTAPLRPLSRIAIKCIVQRTLARAGIESPSKGAHILRHSAATAMLRHGVSLVGVGAVLRHRSPAMTAHYAKVDLALLSEIAQPWPGRLPC